MALESMNLNDGGSYTSTSLFVKRRKTRNVVLLACFLTFAVGFVVGILIGHFAIDSGDDSHFSSGQEGCNEIPTTETPCFADDILAEANPDVSGWIMTMLNTTNIRENLRNLTAQPHLAGTDMDFKQADMLRQFWLDAGLDVATTTSYNVTLSYPNTNKTNKFYLEDISTGKILVESPDEEENVTWSGALPPFFGYAPSGNISGRCVVYANYARKEDFETLDSKNINVSGCIVLTRFGSGGRKSKVRYAEDWGASGVLIYADPADWIDDHVSLDDVYPNSYWIPPTATPRGNIYEGIGDMLTPGFPATETAYRVEEDKILPRVPKIPALPIGYGLAQQIFQLMDGENVTDSTWTGRLPVTYKYGFSQQSNVSGSLEINNFNGEMRTSYNAFGLIRGAVEPDRYVLLGNHRDSWVNGAVDPSSGTAVMMELSRVLGSLVKEGKWRPRRSIIFCSWGSEEYSLIGSTEWVEENAKILDYRAVAYINMDIAVTGREVLRALGSAPVFQAMYRAAKKVQNPNSTDTERPLVYDDWLHKRPWIDPKDNSNRGVPVIPTPGGGSDYGSFQMRAGVTCADFRYDEDFSGNLYFYSLYHTGYETFEVVDKFIDPGFTYHATIGKLSGELLRDLSDSLVLPFNVEEYGLVLEDYTYNLFDEFKDDLDTYNIGKSHLDEAIQAYKGAAESFHMSLNSVNKSNPFEIRRVNDQMMLLDRTFLVPEGLPDRPQFKHVVHSTRTLVAKTGSSFSGLTDTLMMLRDKPDDSELQQTLKLHYSVVIFTINSATGSLKDTTAFLRE